MQIQSRSGDGIWPVFGMEIRGWAMVFPGERQVGRGGGKRDFISRPDQLNQINDHFFGTHHGSCRSGPARTFCINLVSNQPIFFRINLREQFGPEFFEPLLVQMAFEDAVLDADTVILAGFGYSREASGGGDVVADESEHGVGKEALGFRLGKGVHPPLGKHGLVHLEREEPVGVFKRGFELGYRVE
jgi:hypothetical protein